MLNEIIHNSKDISKIIDEHQITIISAGTGTGKTIFIPRIIIDNGLAEKIVITETRRISCLSAAKFASKIFKTNLGEEIGYIVRFEKIISKQTTIRYVTDGVLLNEFLEDPLVLNYDCLIIDEFHLRTLSNDMLISFIKHAFENRRYLKIIFMSATTDSNRLASFFNCKIGKVVVKKKSFDLSIFHTKFAIEDYLNCISALSVKISLNVNFLGNQLIFLPGRKEINELEFILTTILNKSGSKSVILKLMASSSLVEQKKTMNPKFSSRSKIILSTNVAETSLTVPDVLFVIDGGFNKQKLKNWKMGIDLFKNFPISKSEAIQRSGRAGRQKPGICYRMYTRASFLNLKNYPVPDLHRADISWILLQLLSSPLSFLSSLDFFEVPPIWSVKRSLEILFILNLLDLDLKLTRIGKLVAIFPLDIRYTRAIMESLFHKDKIATNWLAAISSTMNVDVNLDIKLNNSIKRLYSSNTEFLGEHHLFGKVFFLLNKTNFMNEKKFTSLDSFEKDPNFWLSKKVYSQTNFTIEIIKAHSIVSKNNKKRISSHLSERISFFLTSGLFFNLAVKKKRGKYIHVVSGILGELKISSYINREIHKFGIFDHMVLSTHSLIFCFSPIKLYWALHFGSTIYM